jgi:hypothetical protein
VTDLPKLNLPGMEARTRAGDGGRPEIFDPVRKKFVRLTPEEWVRQHFLHFMTGYLGYPPSLVAVEAAIRYNRMVRRFDILAYRSGGIPALVVECKAPSVRITQDVFDQAAMYNMTLKVGYLAVTNGLEHFACRIDHEKQTYAFLPEMPTFESLKA